MSSPPAKKQPDLFLTGSIYQVASFREDMDLMSHPFSAVEKGRTEPMIMMDHTGKSKTHIKVTGADYGIATVWDNDILIYLRTQVAIAMNRGEAVSRRIRFSVYDCLRATKRGTGKQSYELFRAALQRLKATTIITNISADGITLDQGVSWISDYTFVAHTKKNGDIVMGACEIEVSEWTWKMFLDARRMLAIDQAYFDIKGAIERKIYGIIRKGMGQSSVWHIGLQRLQEMTGSSSPPAKFRYTIKSIVERQSIPGVVLELTEDYRMPGIAQFAPTVVGKRGKLYLVARPRNAALKPA